MINIYKEGLPVTKGIAPPNKIILKPVLPEHFYNNKNLTLNIKDKVNNALSAILFEILLVGNNVACPDIKPGNYVTVGRAALDTDPKGSYVVCEEADIAIIYTPESLE